MAGEGVEEVEEGHRLLGRMDSLDHVIASSTNPSTTDSVALPGASTARFHYPNSLHGETELTAIHTLDEEQIGGDLTSLLDRSEDSSSTHRPPLPYAPLLDDRTGRQREANAPVSDVHEHGAVSGNARLQLKGPRWLFKGQGWNGAFPLKW